LPRNYRSFDAKDIPDAVPQVEPKSRYGNPPSYVVLGKRYHVLKSAHCYKAKGKASWYGTMFHERLTSSREPYNMYKMTAANKVLPLPTYVRVHNLDNGRTIIVKVNDRGPFHVDRVIDLSFAAAKRMGMIAKGTANVEIEAIDPRHPNASCDAPQANIKKATGKAQPYLQFGAYGTKNTADKLANRLVPHSEDGVYVRESQANNNPLYKVQVGPFTDAAAANTAMIKFKQLGFNGVFTVVR
jgi:rare lipoprotein A